ncbi:polysaccharide biosynthesis protein [Planomicrobium sp. YIM 101495]|uniref:putative polysaccharide biosynthesis protein n=1 Tax=Planomicrobium sp. YIM 101495 TaxID=2665160 RepID=UPI0012B9ADF0|nr:polysaccharide biosynthesis protein [Planomicrobium sp. YIM 101495]MTD29525.1 oligosaccharide flippase family protein [Planomicrobium sp. YIM 101495]
MSTLLKGTAILTLGLFLSKVLGVIYIIPFYGMVGEENIVLYQYAYIPYNLMLAVAISGAPLAFSKYVAKYNSLGDYETGRRLLKSGLLTMMVTGFASFLALYFLADVIAQITIDPKDEVFTVDDVADVIRWVSFALIVVPFMSLWRGFFQGYNYMMPTAVSQLIEQIVRIAFLLAGVYAVIHLMGGTPKSAIQFAVLSAAIGAVGGLLSLVYFWRKKQPEYNELRLNSVESYNVRLRDMYKEILTYAIPIVFLGVANPLFQLVDMLTFSRGMREAGNAANASIYLGMLNISAHKLVMIPVMLATGFSMALIPLITKYYTKNEHRLLTRTLDQSFQIILFLTVPAVIGMAMLSDELYHVFYEISEVGSGVLAFYLPAAILFALFPVTASILQGINQQKWIILNLLVGLLLKLSLNIPLITAFETYGAILATVIGYCAAIGMNIAVIMVTMNYRSKLVVRRTILIILLNGVMALAVLATLFAIDFFIPMDAKWQSIIRILIVGAVGGAVYGYLSLKIGIAQKLFGERLTKITRKFGF